MNTSAILMTSKAKCHDCYRCVRVCPVKAIRIENGQAQIDADRCILCGTCVRECPQGAKSYRDDSAALVNMILDNKVVASVAPSFAAVYGKEKAKLLPSALRQLGFYRVEETGIGAEAISKHIADKLCDNSLDSGVCTACPVVVNYYEKYKAEDLNLLMPVVSPMVAHAKLIKRMRPNVRVAFIGPCIAKKAEAERKEYAGLIDIVITFSELDNILSSQGINISSCIESEFDSYTVNNSARAFALPGSMLKTIDKLDNKKIYHTSGAANTIELIDSLRSCPDMEILEPLFCHEGCINGPGVSCDSNLFQRRSSLENYILDKRKGVNKNDYADIKADFRAFYYNNKVNLIEPTDKQINDIYIKTGKANPERRLDCSACGYRSCRENAIAIINGMAEPEMCLPYMRLLAEKRSDRIMETSPNGLIILNDKLRIIAVNSSFMKYFMVTDAVCGRHINNLMDSKDYEKVLKEGGKIENMLFIKGKEYHQIIYSLPEEKQLIGIFVDVAAVKITEAKIKHMRKQTAEQAQILLQHQVEMAQQLTKFLGENTAKSEALLEKFLDYDE